MKKIKLFLGALCFLSIKILGKRLLRLLLLLTLVFIDTSCTNHSYNKVFEETVHLGLLTNMDVINLKATKVEQSLDFFNAKTFFVYQDSILVVINKPNVSNHFVIFHNMNRNENIAEFIQLGRASNEMFNCMAHIQNHNLVVHDFVKNQLAIINMDSVISEKNNYKLKPFLQFSNSIGSSFVTLYDKDKFIMLNPYCFEDKKIDINNEQPRFIVSESSDDRVLKYRDDIYIAYNVSQGTIIPNQKRDRVIFASCFLSELEFYTYNLSPIKRVVGLKDIRPSYIINEDRSISFSESVPYTYMDYYLTEESLYFTYTGDYLRRDTEMNEFTSHIIEFDWDGNIQQVYYSPEYIYTIYKSSDKDVFYGRGFDENGTVVLWKLSK